jgi:hypothetical protein
MTDVKIELTPTLQGTLGHQGVFAYAVYFADTDTTPGYTGPPANWTVLVDGSVPNPTVPDSATITLPSEYVGGKIYLIIQSKGPDSHGDYVPDLYVPSNPTSSAITQESDLNWDNATSRDFRYDSFELTLTPSANDQGNLTSVNGWGIPMEVTVKYADNSTATRGYHQSGDWMWGTTGSPHTGIGAIDPDLVYSYTAGPLATKPRMAASPTEAVGNSLPGFAASDWSAYVQSLQTADPGITIAGYFNGAPDAEHIWHNAGAYSYDLTWDGSNFWLNASTTSQIKGSIQISAADLENSIYSTLGTADIYSSQGGTQILDDMNTGANNQWGAVLAQFLTGFTAGYYGATGNPLNSSVSGTVDLNKSWNWDPTYAFGNNHATTSPNVFYDKYAELFFDQTNSYGSGYSDNLMKAFTQGGPLVSVANPSGADVDTITLRLFDDTETPTGYVPPEIDNIIHSPSYVARNDDVNLSLNITLNFNAGQMALADKTPITLGFYTATSGGVAQFNTVSFPTDQGSLFQNWNLIYDAGSGTYSLQPYSPPVWQPPGSLLINQWPVSPALDSGGDPIDGGVNWYQITVGSGDAAKTFNLYLTSDTTGQVYNPDAAGHEGAIAIDGLAVVVPPTGAGATLATFPINFFDGGAITVDSSLLSQVTAAAPGNPVVNQQPYIDQTPNAAPWAIPDAPVIGALSATPSGTTFTQAAAPGTPVPTLINGNVAFGWFGADGAWVAAQNAANNYVVQNFTNKVGATNWARINLSNGTTVPVQADFDGAWYTAMTPLGNGSYTATMSEYQASSGGYALNKTSASVSFVIQADALQIEGAGSSFISLDQGGSATDGNWIRLETTGSSLPNGTLLAYATDALGNLVSRDGETGPGVTLEEATLARIGSVASDTGAVLFNGGQSVYLKADLQLHFAIQTGDNNIEQLPNVVITGMSSLTVDVSGNFGTLHLLATVNNNLSANADLASAQRTHDEAWTYLTEGSTIHVEVAGSAANTNTVHFVLFEVDAAGAWSVDGVAYGNTDAFRSAVQANLDDGFAAQAGGGTFFSAANWTIGGTSGFYAPVLVTQDGDIFMIGTANVDGREHIRAFGENVFGFEDVRADQGSDFDYNDMIVHLTVI